MFGGCDEPHSVCTETAPALAEHRAPEIKLSYESSDNEFDIGVSSARVAPPASLGLITDGGLSSDSDDELVRLNNAPDSKASAVRTLPVTTSRGRVSQASERFKPSKRDNEEEDPIFKEFLRMAKKKKEQETSQRRQMEQLAEMDKENQELAGSMQQWDELCKKMQEHDDLDADTSRAPVIFQRVPALQPPAPSCCRSCTWVRDLFELRNAELLEKWLDDQAFSMRMSEQKCSCSCGLILDTILYRSEEVLSTKAVTVAARLVEQGWGPTHRELLNAMLDFGLVLDEIPQSVRDLLGERKPRGIYVKGSRVEVRYDDGWHAAVITGFDRATETHTVKVDSDGDEQQFTNLEQDPDIRMPPSEEDDEDGELDADKEDTFRGRPPVNLLPCLWLLQVCFVRRRLQLSLDETVGWLELLFKIRVAGMVSKACADAHRLVLPWNGAGHSPAQAVDACVAVLINGASEEDWRGHADAQEHRKQDPLPGICARMCSYFANAAGEPRPPTDLVLPDSKRGTELGMLVSASILRRLAPGSELHRVESTPIAGPEELFALTGHIVVSKNTPSLISLGQREAHADEFSTVLRHLRDAAQHVLLRDGQKARGPLLEQVRGLMKRCENWNRALSNTRQTTSILSAKGEIIALLSCLNGVVPVNRCFLSLAGDAKQIQQPTIDSLFKRQVPQSS